MYCFFNLCFSLNFVFFKSCGFIIFVCFVFVYRVFDILVKVFNIIDSFSFLSLVDGIDISGGGGIYVISRD